MEAPRIVAPDFAPVCGAPSRSSRRKSGIPNLFDCRYRAFRQSVRTALAQPFFQLFRLQRPCIPYRLSFTINIDIYIVFFSCYHGVWQSYPGFFLSQRSFNSCPLALLCANSFICHTSKKHTSRSFSRFETASHSRGKKSLMPSLLLGRDAGLPLREPRRSLTNRGKVRRYQLEQIKAGCLQNETTFAARVGCGGKTKDEEGRGKRKDPGRAVRRASRSANGVEQPVLASGRAGYLMLLQVSGAAASIRRLALAGSYGTS